MELSYLNIPKAKVEQLQKAGIHEVEDLPYYFPRKYIDRTCFTGILPEGESIFLFECTSVHAHTYRRHLIEAIGTLAGTQIPVHILWFSQPFLQQEIEATRGKQVFVAGVATYKAPDPTYRTPARYEVSSPAVYSANSTDALRIYPAYKKVAGMADEYLLKVMQTAFDLLPPPQEIVPEAILKENNLISHAEMIKALHAPSDAIELTKAQERQRFDDLLYFALRLEMNNRRISNGSTYNLSSLTDMNKVRDGLPYNLTNDQASALTDMIAHIRSGRRLNALLQGDVGCGKTIVAALLMIAFSGNGHQAVLMAPTTLLAKQHYSDMQKLCDRLNIPVALLISSMTEKEKREVQDGLANGSIRLVIGTTTLLNEKYKFKSLALVVEDEEHKYGVMQRASLAEKAAAGTHVLTMSATPIPRSLAQTIYGDNVQLYTINQKPAGRKPVMTGIAPDANKAVAFLRRSCREGGHQAYVVCPMITESDAMEGVTAAEEAYEFYNSALNRRGEKEIPVALVTGDTPPRQAAQILQSFAEGAISVLVSTTIIEVGVNVPNANCIIIHNAERFGIAQLHQLRGRVGRGSSDAFCCLISSDPYNPRLQAMVKTNNGFEIAQMDLQQRGAGDFLGIQQSGTERLLSMALQYPQEYKSAQKAAQDILDIYSDDCLLLQKAQDDMENQVGGDILPK